MTGQTQPTGAELSFALFAAGDAYSTEQKIMGRQSAGQSFIRGIALALPRGVIPALGPSMAGGQALQRQLQDSGFEGSLRWSTLPDFGAAAHSGSLYFPGPPTRELAAVRNAAQPGAFSLMGLTHTVASKGATDEIAALVLPPFKPWDALICTSQAALTFVSQLHEDMRQYWREHTGATRFNPVHTPVIPLGINTADFARTPQPIAAARKGLGIAPDEVVFLFAGRLTFHAKANPAPAYQALQAVLDEQSVRAKSRGADVRLVCIEAGVYPNDGIRQAYETARQALAPGVRFITVDGADRPAYRQAWQAADVFLSPSDNIQETFGLTPVEAMAAGLPVVVSDWNGYKDTVRHGVDGFRVPTMAPPPGAGRDLALAHAVELCNYDFHIGRTSLATVVEPRALREAIRALVHDPALRQTMGQAAALRARTEYDWQAVLPRYRALADELAAIRLRHAQDAGAQRPSMWPPREDAFCRFAHFPTTVLQGHWSVVLEPDARARLATLMDLHMSRYGWHDVLLPQGHPARLLECLEAAQQQGSTLTAQDLLNRAGLSTPPGVRALMWLWKFAVVRVG
jgi:glycosyltransferase involved in cell wall biosynthesis